MDNLCVSFERVSCDAGVSDDKDCLKNSRLCLEYIPSLELQLEEYEKVSVSFLFFDDIVTCFNICKECVNCQFYGFLSENSFESCKNWSEKLLECIFYVQNILLLNQLGISKYDAERYFQTPRAVSKQRILFYKICENLTNKEIATVMEDIPSVPSHKYAEIYILNVLTSEKYLKSFLVSLSHLNNPVISDYIKELNKDLCIEGIDKSIPQLKHSAPKHIKVNSDDIYPIKDPNNVGLCFIINEANYKDQQSREGSLVDVTLIESTMKYFNFDVITFADVPKNFFKEDLNKNIKTYFKDNHSAFFMFIMSHGIQGAIYCTDGELVTIDYIIMVLSCKNLLKIPKVLIVQACQGEKILLKDIDKVTDGPGPVVCDQSPKQRSKLTFFEYYISDFLQVMATIPGFRALRNEIEGTWFIQSFCKCLKEKENDCIFSIITQTIKRVKDHSLHTKLQNIDIGQHPEMRSLFEKKLYLKPCISD